MARDFTPKQAIREAVPLLLGVSGPPGSGKTNSSLLLATGIKADRGGDIIFLDNDGDRAKSYAPRAGEKPNFIDTFDFLHVSFDPPYSPLDFKAIIKHQLQYKPACIIVDSMSMEHEGDGGVLSWQEAELTRMAGEDWGKRERMNQAAWKEPKRARIEMINFILGIKTPVIFCFKAREKTKQLKNDKGKMVPTNVGWTPIAPPEIVGSMTLFCLLPIRADGVPMWKGNTAYEDFSIKLPAQFRGFLQEGKALNQEMGRAMSEWARGVAPTGFVHDAGTTKPQEFRQSEPSIDLQALRTDAGAAADIGDEALTTFLGTLSKPQKDALRPYGADLRAKAQAVGKDAPTDAGTQPDEQSKPQPDAQPDAPIDDQPYKLSRDPETTIEFESESEYLAAYEEIVDLLFMAGNQAGLLRFDQRNKPLIDANPGLADAAAAINRRVRATGQQGLGV